MKNLAVVFLALTLLVSCRPQKRAKKLVQDKEEKVMAEAKQGKIDTAGVKDLLQAYENYAAEYSSDTAGANFLFKAADFYRYLRQPKQAIETYRKVYNNYPDFENRPYALFLQGFIYENDLGKTDSARTYYREFLTRYPDNTLARDVRVTLDNLGKSPEQLVKEFEQKQQADSLAQAK